MKHVRYWLSASSPFGRRFRMTAWLAACALSFAGGAAAQQAADDPPLIGLHYQDVLADDPGVINLSLVGPNVDWTDVAYSTGSDCLSGAGRADNPGDAPLILELQLTAPSCLADVDLVFYGAGDQSWPAWARLMLKRLPDAPLLHDLDTSLSLRDVSLPGGPILARHPTLLAVRLNNYFDVPVLFSAVADISTFVEEMGEVYRLPDSDHRASYTEIRADGAPFETTVIGPNDDLHYVVIVDTQRRLPSGSGTATVGAYGLLELGDETYIVPTIQWTSFW